MMKNFENWFSETFIERNHRMIEWDDGEQHIVGEKEKVKALCKWAWDAGIASIVDDEIKAVRDSMELVLRDAMTTYTSSLDTPDYAVIIAKWLAR